MRSALASRCRASASFPLWPLNDPSLVALRPSLLRNASTWSRKGSVHMALSGLTATSSLRTACCGVESSHGCVTFIPATTRLCVLGLAGRRAKPGLCAAGLQSSNIGVEGAPSASATLASSSPHLCSPQAATSTFTEDMPEAAASGLAEDDTRHGNDADASTLHPGIPSDHQLAETRLHVQHRLWLLRHQQQGSELHNPVPMLADKRSSSPTYKLPLGKSNVRVPPAFAYPAAERNKIRESWYALMRWSKVFRRTREGLSPLEATSKVVVFGGGSFGTAMGVALAAQKPDLQVVLLLRDASLCRDINLHHCNSKYLKDFELPPNVVATTVAAEAILGAQYAVHAVPVQSSRAFLKGIKDLLPASIPVICVSKGLEASTGDMMSEVIPSALERRQPAVFLSGPSFAKEVMQNRPTGLVAACKDTELAKTVQFLFASQSMRVNTTSDVVGVEICGALKNVLAIAAGIVEGLDLGHNAMAALIAQGCAEIRWLAEKTGAKPTTVSGLSGLGDIMLTCYGDLSRNRSVGIRLGRGERLEDIIASSSQVAEGVATAGVVVGLARKYRVSLPVLTAVAQVLDNALTPREAVYHVMNLPQIEES